MGVFVFALGGSLMVLGAAAVGYGAEIVEVERGWTEVIGGSVALSSGAIIVALACILVRLGRLQHLLMAGGIAAVGAPPKPPLATSEALGLAVPPPPPEHSVVDLPVASIPLAPPSEDNDAAPSIEPERAPPPASAAVETSPIPLPNAAPPESPLGAPVPPASAPSPADPPTPPSESEPPTAQADTPEAEGEVSAAPSAQPVPRKDYSVDWLERELTNLDAQFEVSASRMIDPEEQKAQPKTQRPEAVLEARQAERAPESSAGEHADPPAAAPAITGRYSAGGVSYALFADGSIEADTAGGVFRFRSLSELKAFIEEKGAAPVPTV